MNNQTNIWLHKKKIQGLILQKCKNKQKNNDKIQQRQTKTNKVNIKQKRTNE